MYIHKNGITLRKLERKDLSRLMALKNESWFGTHTITFVNIDDQCKWFESLNPQKQMVLVAEKNGKEIGLYKISNIDWINRKYDSAHDVFKEYRGMGYSTPILEAGVDFGFEVLNMHRLDTEVLENNIASLKSALKVGFIQEGIKRACIHKCGTYLNSTVLGIIREEWEKLDRVITYGGVCNESYKPKNKI